MTDTKLIGYCASWKEFWWDGADEGDRSCGYLADYEWIVSASTPQEAYDKWRVNNTGLGTFRPDNGALKIENGRARWESANPVFFFDLEVVGDDSVWAPPIPDSEEDESQNFVEFFYGIYAGHLKPFGFGEGQRGVEDYVTEHCPEIEWRFCMLCDNEEPTYSSACLVCGNPN